MVKEIVRDALFLAQKSEPAKREDRQTALDLLDTLRFNSDRCVGMAANMIGVRKRIIAVDIGMMHMAMLNPVIVRRSGAYETEEGCLSLPGVRKTTRYRTIEVEFADLEMKRRRMTFEGFAAQIIQHEVDHCDGILI